MTAIDYTTILTKERFSPEKTNTDIENSFSSDKSRVIFSSSFRRLQQKAQVFSLEKNPSVRSRLTHTLEVANTGNLIAKRVADELIQSGDLAEKYRVPFIDITETCCLLHDIGNPPFGHFGEAAIQKWFELYWKSIFQKSTEVTNESNILADSLINDFLFFDGNPQGVRIALYLQDIPGNYQGTGLNLTFSQILSIVKYTRTPDDARQESKEGKIKKPGYFHSESGKIETIRTGLGWKVRFPITYLMEAADDISYCLSDIEDGIEKGIITSEIFFSNLFADWTIKNLSPFEYDINVSDLKTKHDFFRFKIHLTRSLIKKASHLYIKHQPDILAGTMGDLLEKDDDAKEGLGALKRFSRKYLFRSPEAESIELHGYKVIFGLLEGFKPLLQLSYHKFHILVRAKNDVNAIEKKDKLDVEWRLFNRLSERQLEAYNFAIADLNQEEEDFLYREWYYRAHLIVDYVSGMTDNFALETYKLLNGISL